MRGTSAHEREATVATVISMACAAAGIMSLMLFALSDGTPAYVSVLLAALAVALAHVGPMDDRTDSFRAAGFWSGTVMLGVAAAALVVSVPEWLGAAGGVMASAKTGITSAIQALG